MTKIKHSEHCRNFLKKVLNFRFRFDKFLLKLFLCEEASGKSDRSKQKQMYCIQEYWHVPPQEKDFPDL